jgi:sigma-B regulation protein RsbU (phosphoserine phosphatase)
MDRLKQAIADRDRIEQVLAHESDLLHALMDNIPDTIYFKDMQSRFTRIDRAQAEMLGVARPEDALGKTDADFFTPEHARAALADEQRLLRTGEPLVGKMEKIRRADGKFRWVTATKVPVRDKQDRIIGLVGISRDVTERVEAEEKVAAYSAVLRERNLQMEADLVLAREVQEALLPQQFPSFPPTVPSSRSALRFASRYQPCAMVGGDFLDVLRISDTQAGLFVCDVMGKGVRAALVTAMMRALVEELLPIADSPSRFLAGLNRGLVSILQERQLPMFASAYYVVADSVAGELRFANAGHPTPFYLRPAAGTAEQLRTSDFPPGPVLGVFDNSLYAEGRMPVAPGDRLMLFTDGLYEVVGSNDEEYGQGKLLDAVRQRLDLPMSELFDQLLAEVRAYSASKEFSDDICLLGVEVAGAG